MSLLPARERLRRVVASVCDGGVSGRDSQEAAREMFLYRDQLDIMVHLTARYDNWMFSYGDPFNPGSVPGDW